MDKPPTHAFWFKAIVQECLLEAESVEITIRDMKGQFVHDKTRAGVVMFDNSTQSEWIELPHEFNDYLLESVVFRSAHGQALYTIEHQPDDSVISIRETQPNHAHIIIVNCEQLQNDIEHGDEMRS